LDAKVGSGPFHHEVLLRTSANPKLRYTVGALAGRANTLRRIVPARAFDRQIRKLNHLAA
jgi:hypothetical protein